MEQFYFHTEKITIGYDNKPLIEDISIGIKKGEIVTIIGPNGSGKSTLLKSIIKELKILGGTSFLKNEDLNLVSEKELAKKMSILMTERIKPELMTCFDVVATGRYPYTNALGLLKKEDEEMIAEALKMVHGEELADKDFNCISDGQKQRILLARCIAQNPEFIVLDEPTSFLDIKYKIELLEILKRLKEEKNVAILMSMHELDIAEYISDKVICVGKDGIDFVGKPAEVFNPEYIQKLFDIEKESYEAFFKMK